ncbi:MAG: hypothetical protein WCH07_03250 [Deltaproteobacteria bacterium]
MTMVKIQSFLLFWAVATFTGVFSPVHAVAQGCVLPDLIVAIDTSKSVSPGTPGPGGKATGPVYTTIEAHAQMREILYDLIWGSGPKPGVRFQWTLPSAGRKSLPFPLVPGGNARAVAYTFDANPADVKRFAPFEGSIGARQWLDSTFPEKFPGDKTDFALAAAEVAKTLEGCGDLQKPVFWAILTDGNEDVREDIKQESGWGKLARHGLHEPVCVVDIPNNAPRFTDPGRRKYQPEYLRIILYRILLPDTPVLRVTVPGGESAGVGGDLLVDFGQIATGTTATRDIIVENTGYGKLNGKATTDAPFAIGGSSTYALTTGESVRVPVSFCAIEGAAERKLILEGRASASIRLKGTGVGKALDTNPILATDSPAPIILSALVGETTRVVVAIRNVGQATFVGKPEVIANPELRLEGATTITIPQNQKYEFRLIYAPHVPGENRSGEIVIAGNADLRLPVETKAEPKPRLELSTQTVTLDGFRGIPTTASLTLRNTGGGYLIVDASLQKPDPSGVSIALNRGIGVKLGAGESQTMEISARAEAVGDWQTTLAIAVRNDARQGTSVPIDLKFKSQWMSSHSSLAFTTTSVGRTAAPKAPIEITNISKAPLTITASTSGKPFLLGKALEQKLTVGASQKVAVPLNFRPDSSKPKDVSGTLTLAGDDGQVVSVALSATVSPSASAAVLFTIFLLLIPVLGVILIFILLRTKKFTVTIARENSRDVLQETFKLKSGEILALDSNALNDAAHVWEEARCNAHSIVNKKGKLFLCSGEYSDRLEYGVPVPVPGGHLTIDKQSFQREIVDTESEKSVG